MTENRFGQGQRPEIKLPELPVSMGMLRGIVIAVAALIIVYSSVYTIQPEEIGLVMRFGNFEAGDPSRVAGPGLHFKLPLGIDQVIKVPVQRQLKQEFGFRTTGQAAADQRSQYRTVTEESNMLTGDLNAADVEWVVQYRIADPGAFTFNVRNVQDTFRDVSEAVMRQVVGDRTVNEVLTVGRKEVEDSAKLHLQALCDEYATGIVVDQVVLQNVNPPDRVKPSFNEVNRAQQEREQKINLAEAEYNQAVARTKGEAEQIVQQAEGYKAERVNRARGEAARFEAVYREYQKAPEVTRTRLYLETLGDVLPKTGRKVVVDGDVNGVLPLFGLEGLAGKKPAGQGGGS